MRVRPSRPHLCGHADGLRDLLGTRPLRSAIFVCPLDAVRALGARAWHEHRAEPHAAASMACPTGQYGRRKRITAHVLTRRAAREAGADLTRRAAREAGADAHRTQRAECAYPRSRPGRPAN